MGSTLPQNSVLAACEVGCTALNTFSRCTRYPDQLAGTIEDLPGAWSTVCYEQRICASRILEHFDLWQLEAQFNLLNLIRSTYGLVIKTLCPRGNKHHVV